MDKGDLIQERYRLVAPIGTGGMAEVWSAHDVHLERLVAIKLLSDGFRDDPENLVRFFSEAQSIARIQHPNVVTVLDFGEHGGRPYLVMEYMPGGSLTDLCGEPVLPERALDIIAAVAAGAGAAHRLGIVHRDIKPGNILLDGNGVPRLADFGIASSSGAEALTQTGLAIGSPHYLSPEQAQARSAVPASDVYSLGVVLYELLTGVKPFDGPNITAVAIAHVDHDPPPPSDHVPELPPEIDALVLRCMAKDPSARFSDGAELAAAIASGEPSDAWVAPVTANRDDYGDDDGDDVVGPSRRAVAVGAATVVAALALLAVVLFGGNGSDRAVAEEEHVRSPVRRRPAPVASGAPASPVVPVAADGTAAVAAPEQEAGEAGKRAAARPATARADEPEPAPTEEASPEPTPTPTGSPNPDADAQAEPHPTAEPEPTAQPTP